MIKCNVCECSNNDAAADVCKLATIEVTHDKTGADAVATPHYYKNFATK